MTILPSNTTRLRLVEILPHLTRQNPLRANIPGLIVGQHFEPAALPSKIRVPLAHARENPKIQNIGVGHLRRLWVSAPTKTPVVEKPQGKLELLAPLLCRKQRDDPLPVELEGWHRRDPLLNG